MKWSIQLIFPALKSFDIEVANTVEKLKAIVKALIEEQSE